MTDHHQENKLSSPRHLLAPVAAHVPLRALVALVGAARLGALARGAAVPGAADHARRLQGASAAVTRAAPPPASVATASTAPVSDVAGELHGVMVLAEDPLVHLFLATSYVGGACTQPWNSLPWALSSVPPAFNSERSRSALNLLRGFGHPFVAE